MTAPHGHLAVPAFSDPSLGGSNRQERSDQAGTPHHHAGSYSERFPMVGTTATPVAGQFKDIAGGAA